MFDFRTKKRNLKSFFLTLIVAVSVCSLAIADHSAFTAQKMNQSMSYNLPFARAPLLKRANKTSRNATIRKLEKLVDKNIWSSADTLPDSFDPPCDPSKDGKKDCENLVDVIEDLPDLGFDAEEVIESLEDMKAANTRVRSTGRFRISNTTPDGLEIVAAEDGTTIIRENAFSSDVSNNGQYFRYQNAINNYGKYGNAKMKMRDKSAEALGRSIIKKYNLVPAKDRSQLVLSKVNNIRFTGQANDPGNRVVAKEIVFGRRIRGIPVIGGGSQVVIEVIAGNEIRDISVDWSEFEVERKVQQPVNLHQFENRLIGLINSERSVDVETLNISNMMCGYLDFGSKYSDESIVQLACEVVYNYSESSQPELLYVPIGENVAPQDRVFPPAVISAADLQEKNTIVAINYRAIEPPDDSQSSLLGAIASLGGPSGGSSNRNVSLLLLFVAAILFFTVLSFRRLLSKRSTKLSKAALFVSTFALVLTMSQLAVASYTTFMYKNYISGCADNYNNTQWDNYDQWRDEMNDITSCDMCVKNANLDNVLSGSSPAGLETDLVAINTHGNHSGSGSKFYGWFYDVGCDKTRTKYLDPHDDDLEIYINGACKNFSTSNKEMWYGYRNLHRHGSLVSGGCINSCWLYDGLFDSTWNQIGDHIADRKNAIWDAMKKGYQRGTKTNKIAIFGLGRISSNNCDNRARGVSYQNRGDWTEYDYGVNEPRNDTYELCGYYTTLND